MSVSLTRTSRAQAKVSAVAGNFRSASVVAWSQRGPPCSATAAFAEASSRAWAAEPGAGGGGINVRLLGAPPRGR